MTKGEKLEQRYDNGISWTTKDMFQEGKIKDGHGQGSNIEEKMMDQDSWTKESHTSRGRKLMNLICLHLICAYSCACIALHKSLNSICMLVWCMLVIELDW